MDLALAFNVRGLNCKLVFPSRRWFKGHGIPATGVLYYTVETADFTVTKKMVKLR